MSIRRLIIILMLPVWLVRPATATPLAAEVEGHSIGQTDHRPQWDEVGLRDVLAVGAQSTVVPPTVVRVVPQNGAAGMCHWTAAVRPPFDKRGCIVACGTKHMRAVGYIYLIRCLRL